MATKQQQLPRQATLAECNQQLINSIRHSKKTIEMIGPAGLVRVKATEKNFYLSRGYELVDETDTTKETGQQAKAEVKSLDEMKIDELKKYAEDNDIDIEGIKLKPDILAAIKKAESEKAKGQNETSENTTKE